MDEWYIKYGFFIVSVLAFVADMSWKYYRSSRNPIFGKIAVVAGTLSMLGFLYEIFLVATCCGSFEPFPIVLTVIALISVFFGRRMFFD